MPTLSKAAALAGLICTFDLPQPAHADPYSFAVDLTPTQTLTDVYFLFGTGTCAGHAYSHKLADSAPANQTSHFSFDLDMDPADRTTSSFEKWSIFAIYDDANDGVTLGYDPDVAARVLSMAPAPGWVGTLIPAQSAYTGSMITGAVGVAHTEPYVAQSLRAGAPTGLPIGDYHPSFEFFIINNIAPTIIPDHYDYHPDTDTYTHVPTYYPPATLLNFSSASPGGTATATEILPEPSLLAACGLAAFLLPRRPRNV